MMRRAEVGNERVTASATQAARVMWLEDRRVHRRGS
jgi:hypothetical protein